MSATSECLEARNVTRSFDGVVALTDVSLKLDRRQVIGLLGPNGAGKSTLVNLLTGFDRPTDGEILLDGTDISTWRPARRGRSGLGRTFQHGHSFGGLTVAENIEVSALGVGATARTARARADELLSVLNLDHRRESMAGDLPHGEERLLGVARALATSPRFLLLDEPAAGLNEDEAQSFGLVVRMVCEERNIGVLLIDHNLGLVLDVSDHIHFLDQGHTLATGTPEEVSRDTAVMAAYLGQP